MKDTIYLRISRRFSPTRYIRAKKRQLIIELNKARQNNQECWEIEADLDQYYEWETEISDKAIMKEAAKIGLYIDEIEFDNEEPASYRINKYFRVGQCDNEVLDANFRAVLVKKVRERRPIYKKEQREWIDSVSKLVTSFVGVIGALIGAIAVFKK